MFELKSLFSSNSNSVSTLKNKKNLNFNLIKKFGFRNIQQKDVEGLPRLGVNKISNHYQKTNSFIYDNSSLNLL